MRQVAIIEYHTIGLEERVTETPAKQCAPAGWVSRDKVVCDTCCRVTLVIRSDKVARVIGEHLPADLEFQRVWRGAREGRLCVGIGGKGRRHGTENVVDNVLRTADDGVTLEIAEWSDSEAP